MILKSVKKYVGISVPALWSVVQPLFGIIRRVSLPGWKILEKASEANHCQDRIVEFIPSLYSS